MITLDTNLSLICNLFNISRYKIMHEYANKSLSEIMEAEASQGNLAAEKFDKEILNDPKKLIEIFGLDKFNNKYAILRNMNEKDLEELLPLLQPKDLVVGLKFFNKEKLLELIQYLPKDQLVKYIFEMFTPEQVIKLMPEEHINKFLKSDQLDKNLVLKHLKTMKPEVLAQMLEAVTGEPVKSLDKEAMLKQISELSPQKYQDALVSMPKEQKRLLVLKITKEKPKLFELFAAEGYAKVAATKEKPELIKAAIVLEPEHLTKMLQELPQELLAVVVTQINPEKFADVLVEKFKDVLKDLVAA